MDYTEVDLLAHTRWEDYELNARNAKIEGILAEREAALKQKAQIRLG